MPHPSKKSGTSSGSNNSKESSHSRNPKCGSNSGSDNSSSSSKKKHATKQTQNLISNASEELAQ